MFGSLCLMPRPLRNTPLPAVSQIKLSPLCLAGHPAIHPISQSSFSLGFSYLQLGLMVKAVPRCTCNAHVLVSSVILIRRYDPERPCSVLPPALTSRPRGNTKPLLARPIFLRERCTYSASIMQGSMLLCAARVRPSRSHKTVE